MGIKPLLASSIVSSRMLKTICHKMKAQYVDGLTGFNNIINAALNAETNSGYRFVFAYEEAIGFLVGQVVLDKDGINAGVRFMEIAGYLAKENKTIWQFLDELYCQFGIFINTQWSLRFDGSSAIENMTNFMKKVRSIKTTNMANCLDQSECERYDLTLLQKTESYQGMCADVVIFEADKFWRLIVRPSGTEPKIKFYLELFDEATEPKLLANKKNILNEKIAKFKSSIDKLLQN